MTYSYFPGFLAHAQSEENTATPEIFYETGAKLLITEVNFKNKTNDWVEIYYESPTNNPLNIKNFTFTNDNAFKTVGEDYSLESGQYYVLELKDGDADNQSTHLLTTTHSGLTGTTEQIILKDPSGKIVDAICWASAAPTSDELKDMQELFQNEGWISSDPTSCLPSSKVSTNQSIARINLQDTDSNKDWTITDNISPGKPNDNLTPSSVQQDQPPASPVQNSQTKTPKATQDKTLATTTNTSKSAKTLGTPTSVQAATNIESGLSIAELSQHTPVSTKPSTKSANDSSTSKTSNSSQKSTSTKKSSSKKTSYKDGDISSNIIISEIFPHAQKDDRENEWIELSNIGDSSVNLGNWQLDDEEGGSKPYILPDTMNIAANSAIVIKAPDSKLSLGNTKDQVRLFDFKGKLLQTVDFEEAPPNQSYAYITIQQDDGTSKKQWLWENRPTPGKINPQYNEITGTIAQNPQFGNQYSFEMKDGAGRNYVILFNEALIAGPMAQATFQSGTPIKVMGILTNDIQTDFETGLSTTEEQVAQPETTSQKPDVDEFNGQVKQLTEQNPTKITDQTANYNAGLPKLILKKYEVLGAAANTSSQNQTGSPWMFLGLLPPGGAGFWYGIKKIRKRYGKM